MPLSANLTALAQALAGEFENRQQSLDEPVWYVYLRVWQRPVPNLSEAWPTLFIEQVSVAANKPPYRQRVVQLSETAGAIKIQFFALKEPQQFCGAALEPERLRNLTMNDLTLLPTCQLEVKLHLSADRSLEVSAQLPENTLCSFDYQGQTRYIKLGFELRTQQNSGTFQTQLLSYDRGVDPVTQEILWGPRLGPFCLVKQQDYSQELSLA
ncbi:MAG: chorismate mutase [Leptolyngbyaceae cyanobacterium SM1_1_3]|nr:chorismate mutase [Leptolyngbyaceae cyanobacterium SM1_1_3]NJN01389.1 chorismate mutase [Leptolyngbyaceae cyanobacterium RM1_1_2]NJO11149.1 chorismate mutase [Leptolyngbyaceae cyanobacterium SL_1_1]